MHRLNRTDAEIREALDSCSGNKTQAGKILGIHRGSVRTWVQKNNYEFKDSKSPKWKETKTDSSWLLEACDDRITTAQECLDRAGVDQAIWEIERVVVNGWDVTIKIRKGDKDVPVRSQNQQIKVWLRRKVPKVIEDAVGNLLKRLEKKSPVVSKIKRVKPCKPQHRYAFEICLLDPHFGLQCYKGASDADWSQEKCASIIMSSLDDLLEQVEKYMPIEKIMIPFGNDFTHADNVFNTTTKGVVQPEAVSYLPNVIQAETLAIAIVDRVKKVAPVDVICVPGNHDRQTSFWLGRVLNAYYCNDKNVSVAAGPEPYKFWRFGTNLVGLEHGHSIKQTVRLAALMANECKDVWAETEYRVWHLGDQHRQGSGRIIMMEEQGVSPEFVPGLTPPNEWHKLNSFNWQKRGSWGFVWHYTEGLRARLHCNIDRYMNCLLGKGSQ